jgi:hypothetical protein
VDMEGYSPTSKSCGVKRRPGGVAVDPRVQLQPSSSSLNELLLEAMKGTFTDPDAFVDFLVNRTNWPGTGSDRFRAIWFEFYNESPATVPLNLCDCTSQYLKNEENWLRANPYTRQISNYPPPRCTHKNVLTDQERAKNKLIEELFAYERTDFITWALKPWLRVYAADLPALHAGRDTESFREADEKLLRAATSRSWHGLQTWTGMPGPLWEILLHTPQRNGIDPIILPAAPNPGAKTRPETMEMIRVFRERVRWLWILCDGLQRIPVEVPSGSHRPRIVSRTVLHSGQTQQDALNEFTAKLVTPPGRYVAHVKSRRGYFETKLRDALEGHGDPLQLLDVRERSQALYRVVDDEPDEQVPPSPPTSSAPVPTPSPKREPPITRWPAGTVPEPSAGKDPQPEEEPAEVSSTAAFVELQTQPKEKPEMPEPANRGKRKAGTVIPPLVEAARQVPSKIIELLARSSASTKAGSELAIVKKAHNIGKLTTDPADVVVEAELVFDDVAAPAAPPAGLCLGHYLPAEVFSETMGGKSFEMLQTYIWSSQESCNRAEAFLRAGWARPEKADTDRLYFSAKLMDLYHHDRAVKASAKTGSPAPIRKSAIPDVRKTYQSNGSVWEWHLLGSVVGGNAMRPVGWGYDVPDAAADRIAQFTLRSPDYDTLCEAGYGHKYDDWIKAKTAVVYATCGAWMVEVCSWEV